MKKRGCFEWLSTRASRSLENRQDPPRQQVLEKIIWLLNEEHFKLRLEPRTTRTLLGMYTWFTNMIDNDGPNLTWSTEHALILHIRIRFWTILRFYIQNMGAQVNVDTINIWLTFGQYWSQHPRSAKEGGTSKEMAKYTRLFKCGEQRGDISKGLLEVKRVQNG